MTYMQRNSWGGSFIFCLALKDIALISVPPLELKAKIVLAGYQPWIIIKKKPFIVSSIHKTID